MKKKLMIALSVHNLRVSQGKQKFDFANAITEVMAPNKRMQSEKLLDTLVR
ncbi:MAG: hypothetical protein GY792_05725 [Gammaproteobacteria bacterium]|nr:hypothetical protein [Gammaproteobacteria bacterium]